jgi:hypothetical protein
LPNVAAPRNDFFIGPSFRLFIAATNISLSPPIWEDIGGLRY